MGKKKPIKQRNKIVANVVATFGGLESISDICGIGRSAVCQWRETVPYKHQQKLLEHARQNGIQFRAEDFFRLKPEPTRSVAAANPIKRASESKGLHPMS